MRALHLCLVVLFIAFAVATPDYYWRNYDGEVPEDALVAGRDVKGKPIYVGQGFFGSNGLLPGTLHAGYALIKATASKKILSTSKFVKILCSRHPNNFRWKSVTYSDLARLTDVHLVEGGVETATVVYIGRVRHEEDTEIGKVYNVAPYQGLALPNKDNSESSYQQFDVLTYSPNV